ncbi:nectin-2 [Denticeps clupeoides]|uniref:Nectin cell adhesion molecule 3 n=1 Tax=Denticeps clupeoides TaxID=299321 RepID=A0AAY4AB12_9TELE|nr:nectin-2 [Denticeps clupeoides]
MTAEARDGGCRTPGMKLLPSFLLLLFFRGSAGQRVGVDPEVMSYPGQNVTLRCQFNNQGNTELTQVSWILEPTVGERINIAVYHPKFGASYPDSPVSGRVKFISPSLESPSIVLLNLRMKDEGRYICEYATYPTGNEQGITNLVMLAKPRNSASAVTVVAGDQPVVVASCESASGRPAAKITWVTSLKGEVNTVSQQESNNTVTMRSEYKLLPSEADNGKEISCEVEHRTQDRSESFPMKIEVQYPPKVTILGYDNNWYVGRTNAKLVCQAQGNPNPKTVAWRTVSGLMPNTVLIEENKLTVQKVDDSVNTTFVCEVVNTLGAGRDQVTVYVRDAPVNPSNAGVVAGVVIGCLLALLLVGILVAVLITRSRRQQQQGYRGNQKNHGDGAFDIKSRLFGAGKKGSKNGMGSNGAGNNNGPIIYTYRDGMTETALAEKSNHCMLTTTPTAQDILLSGEMDEAERRKFDELEEEDERYDHFGTGGPVLQIRPHDEEMGDGYLDDDMESQRDGSVISRTAVYV